MSARHLSHSIQAGHLELALHENGHRLEELLGFASRLNPRRGYLFVSRVLGKHIPVRPTIMNCIHSELTERLQLLGLNAYVVGMAETAVGLGAGIARHLGQNSEHTVFHHTTRFLVPNPWIRIREAHSHADTMHMAKLDEEARLAVQGTQDLVLVDDEISTGLTLARLAHTLLEQPEMASVKRLHIVSIVSWLSEKGRKDFLSQLPERIDVRFVQLMAGQFSFMPNPDYAPQLPEDVDTSFCDVLLTDDLDRDRLPHEQDGLFGRIIRTSSLEPALSVITRPTVIIGMGEYLDQPFRMALSLEQRGGDVLFQSSTRSPIALGDCIESRIEHGAPGATDKRHYLYNATKAHAPMAFDGVGCPALAEELEACFQALHSPSYFEEHA